MAHITMLESIGLLTKEELNVLLAELRNIYAVADRGEFIIEEGIEDVHSQVELMLTRRLGDMGKKIHSGRPVMISLIGSEAFHPFANYRNWLSWFPACSTF